MGSLDLLLFSTSLDMIARCEDAGLAGVVIDWENVGKERRQRCADTQVNYDTLDDLQRVRAGTRLPIICRVNAFGPSIEEELESAVEAGADEVLLPMVRRAEEIESALALARGRVGIAVMLETVDALRICAEIGRLPVSRVYVGLNDLAIDRGVDNIFAAVADQTVERLRPRFGCPFGLGGLTLPGRGSPIPCRLLMGELARLDCGFTFLRRSFHADVAGGDPAAAMKRILDAIQPFFSRSPDEIAHDRAELRAAIAAIPVSHPHATPP